MLVRAPGRSASIDAVS